MENASQNTAAIQEKRKNLIFLLIIIAAIVIGIFIFNSIFNGVFLAPTNILSVLSHAIIPAFIAWGFNFVFSCGFTDLSLGAVIVLAANMSGILGNEFGYAGLLIGGIAVAAVLLLFNFSVYVYTKIPSWIAGIGLAMIYEAIATLYTKIMWKQGLSVVDLNEKYRALGQVPGIFIIFAAGLIVVWFIYSRSSLGLNIRAVGSNVEVAAALGINIKRTFILAGLLCGIFIGFASVISESYNVRTSALTGLTSLNIIFQPLAAHLLAQALQKKINLMIGIPICALLINVIFNMLTIASVPSGTVQDTVLGVSVIAFGMLAQRKVKGVVK